MNRVDPRLLALLEEPVVRALREAAGATVCHLVGGVMRDRLLDVAGGDFDAVVAARGVEIAERLAAALPARLVPLGGKAFAAYRLVGEGFTLDLWDRRDQSLRADLARRDFTVNALALDVTTRRLHDPFGGLADLQRRRLRATTPGVFADDPLRILRLVRLSAQLGGFRADPGTLGLARQAAPALAEVAAERVREELAKIFHAGEFLGPFDQLVDLDLYPGLFLGRPGTSGDRQPARRRLERLERALERLSEPAPAALETPDPGPARLAVMLSSLPATATGDATTALERCRHAGYLAGAPAALCRRLLACRAPESEADRRWFLHRWGGHWPTALAMLAAVEPALPEAAWQSLAVRLAVLAGRPREEIRAPTPLLDGRQIQQLLGIGPGPRVGAAAERLRRAQVEGRVRSRAAAERLLRSSSSDAD